MDMKILLLTKWKALRREGVTPENLTAMHRYLRNNRIGRKIANDGEV